MKHLLLACAALIAAPLSAQTVAITGGKVVIGDGSAPIEQGVVIVTNGRVVAAGASIAIPAGAQRIDATGKWVTPGIVAGFTRLGLVGVRPSTSRWILPLPSTPMLRQSPLIGRRV